MFLVRRSLVLTMLLAALFVAPGPSSAQGGTATATIAVSATVLSFCTISTAALAFGNYSSVALAQTTTVTVSCTSTTPYNVGLDLGVGSGATLASRKMTGSSGTLGYGLYQDLAHTLQWGPTVGTNTVGGTGNGAAQVLTVYGLVPAAQLVTPGNYANTVTATVSY